VGMLNVCALIEEVLLQLYPRSIVIIMQEYLGFSSIGYCVKSPQISQLPLDFYPHTIVSNERFLYFHDLSANFLAYNLEGQKVASLSLSITAVDIYQNCLYTAGDGRISVFDLQFQLLSSILLSDQPLWYLKVDQNLIYGTARGWIHQVFVYGREGILKHKIGSDSLSSERGEFNDPCGVTVDHNTLYICDRENHRIQALDKKNYSFRNEWGSKGTDNGKFFLPEIIYYREDILYVGDYYSVQLFKCDGTFLQRIGDQKKGSEVGQFHLVRGICVVKDRLYISDYVNKRIQIFQRMTRCEMEADNIERAKLKNAKQNNNCILQ